MSGYDVAALYVEARTIYRTIPGVDCWDAERDARRYAGPWPVVAHPPCGPWGDLAKQCTKQDRSLAPLAVEQVRTWGGVLEHPRHSRLWRHCRLPRPGELPDEYGGWTLEVDQCAWGHVARKRSWLYMVGVPRLAVRPRTGGQPTHVITGWAWRGGEGVTLKVASAQQRRRTPPAFAAWLVALARLVHAQEAAG